MGLDIYCNAYEAEECGAEIRVFLHKWEVGYDGDDNPKIEYAKSYGFRVPEMESFSEADLYIPEEVDMPPTISVRANKWGRAYKPITEFLKKHNIEWSEG